METKANNIWEFLMFCKQDWRDLNQEDLQYNKVHIGFSLNLSRSYGPSENIWRAILQLERFMTFF